MIQAPDGRRSSASGTRRAASANACAPKPWWHCHRRIATDYLLLEGREVRHILGKAPAEPASMTPGAQPTTLSGHPGRTVLIYPLLDT